MKNWNSFEERMHEWKPRQPDVRIEARLFRKQHSSFCTVATFLKLFRSLAPATAALIFGFLYIGNPLRNPTDRSSSITEFREPQLFGTRRLPTVIDSSFFSRNSLPTPTLASTNSGRMISSVSPFSLFVTNTLNH